MANITDVAKLAGVSHQTVSRVLNGENTVRSSTKERVENAIRELNYRPSAAARALVTRRSRMIGVITTGAPLYGPSSTIRAVEGQARAAGYRVMTVSMTVVDRAAMEDAVDDLLRQNVEALVLIVADFATVDVIAGIPISVPLIAAESSGTLGLRSVSIDQAEGARLAVAHLVGLGHRDIVHIAGPDGSVDAAERRRMWHAEVSKVGVTPREPLVGDWTPSSGYAIGARLVETGAVAAPGGATAVFCSNDQMAIGVLHAFSDAGVAVPGDVSVVGFDDIPEAEHFLPPLTTVRQDFVDLGERMMSTLLALLSGEVIAGPIRSEPRVVVRSSTGPVAVTEP